jgi:hypothetical protein
MNRAMTQLVVFCILVVPTAVWIGFDAAKRDWPKGSSTPVWVVGTLLLWIIVFPFYLWKRGRVPLKGETVPATRMRAAVAPDSGGMAQRRFVSVNGWTEQTSSGARQSPSATKPASPIRLRPPESAEPTG